VAANISRAAGDFGAWLLLTVFAGHNRSQNPLGSAMRGRAEYRRAMFIVRFFSGDKKNDKKRD